MPDRVEVGYWLSSEEHGARSLVANAVAAESCGFEWAMISDHLHPWTSTQGHAPFVWGVLGAIANATSRLHVATGVSAPIARLHPVVLAHAAATAAVLLEGRFALGVGTGERLNEHVVGGRWPRPGTRRDMLADAIDVIRSLFEGGVVNHESEWFTVEHAELFTRPEVPPPIWVAVSGSRSAKLAGARGDGMIAVSSTPAVVETFEASGGARKPRCAQLSVCWMSTVAEARSVAHRVWPIAAMPGRLRSELEQPKDFEAAAELVSEDAVAGAVLCTDSPTPIVESILRFGAAGFSRVYVHQVGPDQRGFVERCADEVLPVLI